MTKGELKKCEGLMYDAIIKANNVNYPLSKANGLPASSTS